MSGAMRIEPTCVDDSARICQLEMRKGCGQCQRGTYTLHSGVRTRQDPDLLVPLLFGESFVGESNERSVEVFKAELVAIGQGAIV